MKLSIFALIVATFTTSNDTLYVDVTGAPGPTQFIQAAFLEDGAGVDSVQATGACADWSALYNPDGPLGTYIWQVLAPINDPGFVGRQPVAVVHGIHCGTMAGTVDYRYLEWACGDGWCAEEIYDRGGSGECLSPVPFLPTSWGAVKGLYR